MIKKLYVVLALLLTSFLGACSQLTQYSLSEQQVNDYLQQKVEFQKQLGLPGVFEAHITLKNMSTKIGRVEPNQVILDGIADLNLDTLVGKEHATINLSLAASPYFDHDTGSIYLRDMQLLSATVSPESLDKSTKVLLPYLKNSLQLFFNQTPVYVLDAKRSKEEALVRQLAKGIEIKPGKIVIPLSE
ncbi:MAG: lipoprotein [Plesiomonas sp.]